jgi:uncharacterized membrane protein
MPLKNQLIIIVASMIVFCFIGSRAFYRVEK